MTMDRENDTHVCVLCGDTFTGWGNNPEPLRSYDDGTCCDTCNATKVIPARLGRAAAGLDPRDATPADGEHRAGGPSS